MPSEAFHNRHGGRRPMQRSASNRSETNCKPTVRHFHRKAAPDAKEQTNMLSQVITLVSGCVTFLGGFLIVWGAVSLGLAIREQQGGSQIASAISTIAGGAIVVAAAVYFGMIDTSWLPA